MNEGWRTAARVSREQIEAAKRWDLLSYLQTCEPDELVRSGQNEYATRTHDSLKISHGKWCWNSRGIGGRSALDFLVKVRGMPFVDAVRLLCGLSPVQSITVPSPAERRSFALPDAAVCPSSVVPYLQKRGIDSDIISVCLRLGILYESREHRDCVFVGMDPSGRPRFACLRATRGDFKRDAPGSDKRYSFCLPALDAGCPRLAVAESPIDALSLAVLVKQSGGDWRDSNYLALAGTAPRALLQYLRDYPQITQISLCLDNDRAGTEGMDRLEQSVRDNPALSERISLIYRNPPPIEYGKDYNEFLCTQLKADRDSEHEARDRAR